MMHNERKHGSEAARLSRRGLLRRGTVLGMSAVAGLVVSGAVEAGHAWSEGDRAGMHRGRLRAAYEASQPTGWQPTDLVNGSDGPAVGVTVGGHTASRNFIFQGRPYWVSLRGFQPGAAAPDPEYLETPGDYAVGYRTVLENAFGRWYSFRYQGGLPETGWFGVESYSVFLREPSDSSPALVYGANLYFVYHHPAAGEDGSWRFIQVASMTGGPQPSTVVDNAQQANPFYIWGGRTSVYGRPLVSFNDTPQVGGGVDGGLTPSERFVAETFLVRDTGRRDAAGKDVVDVFGGIRYGWQVTAT
jgi:hypothetical protein